MPPKISIVIIDSDPDAINQMVQYIAHLGDHAVIEGVAQSLDRGYEIVHKKRPMS